MIMATSIYKLRKKISEKKAEAKKFVTACESPEGDIREMSPEEKSKFDAVMADVENIKKQMEMLTALYEEDEDDEEEVEPQPRSGERGRKPGRVSEPFSGAPAVHTREHRYSILRAIQALGEKREVKGLEGEVSREISIRTEKQPQGFYMPLGNEPELRELLYPKAERRDLTTTTGTGAVFVIPELPFIELLRNKLVLKELGATFLTGMVGKFSIPRQSGAGTGYWVTEGVAVTNSNQTLDQVAFVDKTLGAVTNISRKFIYQSSVDAENFVKNDLAKVLAIALDAAGINGPGTGAIPIGILQNTTIQTNSASLALGTSGGAMTWGAIVGLESQVASFNADRGALRYLTAPSVRGKLKTTPKIGTTFPVFIWETGEAPGIGEVNGYAGYATSNVPTNLTKGSGTALGAMIFGNWEDLVIAQWGGIDVIVNPFTNQTSGAVQISMLMEADIQVRHPESFAIISDINYS
jgi:HK97 family phage major capsid protein